MSNGYRLKTRLILLNAAILLFVLGAGGFFLHSAQQQQLLNQLDAELLSIARAASANRPVTASADDRQREICQALKQLERYQPDGVTATLLTPTGQQLCGNRPSKQPAASTKTSLTQPQVSFETIVDATGEEMRRLLFSINLDEQSQFLLQIDKSLAAVTAASRFFALLLIGFGLAAISCVAIGQWFLLNMLIIPVAGLVQLMARTNEENIPLPFQIPQNCGRELQDLSTGYNALTERLALSLRKSRQYSAYVTHELRTPLTILRGETELALRGDKDKDLLLQTLSSNLEEIYRMGHLIEDLLLLSKSELHEVPLQMEAIDLSDLLNELHCQATIIADEKQIQVHRQQSDEPISLFADSHRLRQAVLNLLTNAIKYTPKQGSVTISWSRQKNFAQIIIKDSGIGIDPKHQQHIFDRFYRIDKTRNRHDGGSGLGLAIVKWIVDAHQGSIRVCSAPGQGSCFTVMLPLTHAHVTAANDTI